MHLLFRNILDELSRYAEYSGIFRLKNSSMLVVLTKTGIIFTVLRISFVAFVRLLFMYSLILFFTNLLGIGDVAVYDVVRLSLLFVIEWQRSRLRYFINGQISPIKRMIICKRSYCRNCAGFPICVVLNVVSYFNQAKQ